MEIYLVDYHRSAMSGLTMLLAVSQAILSFRRSQYYIKRLRVLRSRFFEAIEESPS